MWERDINLFTGVFEDWDEFLFESIKLVIHSSYLPLQNLYLRIYSESHPYIDRPLSRRCFRIFAGGISSSSSPFGAAAINPYHDNGGIHIGT
jgi:hypothetical protein